MDRETVRSFGKTPIRAILAEGLGTFILVWIGVGAIVVNDLSEGAVTHLGVSLVFGAVVAALIYTLGHLSGAHFNPAVTLSFWRGGFVRWERAIVYIVAQCVGACLASLVLRVTLGPIGNQGATLPRNDAWGQAFLLETLLTFILMLVIYGSAVDRRAPAGWGGLAIGLTVAVEACAMGPITGASMNPARSLGPALAAGLWQHHWVYWAAPILGAQLALVVYRYLGQGFDFPAESS